MNTFNKVVAIALVGLSLGSCTKQDLNEDLNIDPQDTIEIVRGSVSSKKFNSSKGPTSDFATITINGVQDFLQEEILPTGQVYDIYEVIIKDGEEFIGSTTYYIDGAQSLVIETYIGESGQPFEVFELGNYEFIKN